MWADLSPTRKLPNLAIHFIFFCIGCLFRLDPWHSHMYRNVSRETMKSLPVLWPHFLSLEGWGHFCRVCLFLSSPDHAVPLGSCQFFRSRPFTTRMSRETAEPTTEQWKTGVAWRNIILCFETCNFIYVLQAHQTCHPFPWGPLSIPAAALK